jgi:2'-5' RNA ligase
MLMAGQPQVRSLATEVQSLLSSFEGFHLTPLEWLHMTTQVVGAVDKVDRSQFGEMLAVAHDALHNLKPVPVTAERLLYHPEAIMLSVEPAIDLQPVREAAQRATRKVLIHSDEPTDGSKNWTPHVTIAYSTKDQPAQPIISALGKACPNLQFTVEELTLVVQWGKERLWDWEPVGTVKLSG